MTMLIGCMMAMNAADLLELSLGSLHGKVDELVVIDGGSTDVTKSVSHGLRHNSHRIQMPRRQLHAAPGISRLRVRASEPGQPRLAFVLDAGWLTANTTT